MGRPKYLKAIPTIMLLTFPLVASAGAQDEKAKKKPGSDFPHPIYLPTSLDKASTVKGIGDALSHPDIIYILRLEEGQQLTATLSTVSKSAQGPGVLALSLVDGRATSLEDAQTIQRSAAPPGQAPKERPGALEASITYVAPDTADYFLVAEFQTTGTLFQLTTTAKRVVEVKSTLACATGPVREPTYRSPGLPGSLISDFTIGDPARADPPDPYNRHFCLTSCEVRPPTSLVLTTKLQYAFENKTRTRACWDSSNTITEVSSSR
jgi:hypothetical protein